MNKIEFSKLSTKEDMILAFNQLKDDYRQLFAINEDLQEENEFLKLDNPEMNIEHFRIIKENKRKIDNLRKENERLTAESTEWESKCYDLQKENENYRKIIKRVLRKLNATVNHFKSKQKNNCIEHSISILSGDE